MQNCYVNGAPSEEFCSSQSGGITCAASGNPVCRGMPGSPTPTQETEGPPTPSLQEDPPTFTFPTATPTTGTEKTLLESAIPYIPVAVGVIGLATAWVQRKKIIHVFHHNRSS